MLTRTAFRIINASLTGLLLGLFAVSSSASGVLVISAEEFDQAQSWNEDDDEFDRALPVPGAPIIIVDRPDTSIEVMLPVEVSVAFQSAPDARIDPDTLVVRYGFVRITDKVREHLEVSAEGIKGLIDGFRPGSYRLRISISDTLGRTGNADVSFNAVKPGGARISNVVHGPMPLD